MIYIHGYHQWKLHRTTTMMKTSTVLDCQNLLLHGRHHQKAFHILKKQNIYSLIEFILCTWYIPQKRVWISHTNSFKLEKCKLVYHKLPHRSISSQHHNRSCHKIYTVSLDCGLSFLNLNIVGFIEDTVSKAYLCTRTGAIYVHFKCFIKL